MDEPAWLTVVWGPAGYGKRTLITSWIRSRNPGNTLWIDKSLFYLPNVFWGEVSRRVVDELPSVLIIDFTHIADAKDPESELKKIHVANPGLRIIVTTRYMGDFWSHGMPSPGLAAIGPGELAFRIDELPELLGEIGLRDSNRSMREVIHLTGGHPMLVREYVQISGLFGPESRTERTRVLAVCRRQADRFVDSVLNEAPHPNELRDHAHLLARLTWVTVRGAAALGIEDPVRAVNALERGG